MSDRQLELAHRWLIRADHDLITARQTLLLADSPTDTPCFHAQQAIEKSLKALLTYHQIAFPKTHDLLRLLDLTLPLLSELEAVEALTLAEEIVVKVRAELPMS
jgi:HEPN domain-containing protein